MTCSKLYTMAELSDTGSGIGSDGVVLSKKPRQPREVRILSTSYHPSSAGADATPPTHRYEIGVDEAGRGPLFGRVYTGAVILPHPAAAASAAASFDFSLLKDSKKFTSEKKIREVSDYIKQHAVAWAVAYEEPAVIDALNIRRATLQCMRTAINAVIKNHGAAAVSPAPAPIPTSDYLLLIDGNDFIPMGNFNQRTSEIENYRHVCVEGGDDTYACIAAGSILAKVARDDYIEKLCDEYPVLDELYSLRGNKGYGAKKHMDGIREHGITQWHRRSYGICRTFE